MRRKACTRVCPTLSPQPRAPRDSSPIAREPHQIAGNFPGAQLVSCGSRPRRCALPATRGARAQRRSAPPAPGARCAARARAAGGSAGGDSASVAAGWRLGLLRRGQRGGGRRGGGRKEGAGGGRGSAGAVAWRAQSRVPKGGATGARTHASPNLDSQTRWWQPPHSALYTPYPPEGGNSGRAITSWL